MNLFGLQVVQPTTFLESTLKFSRQDLATPHKFCIRSQDDGPAKVWRVKCCSPCLAVNKMSVFMFSVATPCEFLQNFPRRTQEPGLLPGRHLMTFLVRRHHSIGTQICHRSLAPEIFQKSLHRTFCPGRRCCRMFVNKVSSGIKLKSIDFYSKLQKGAALGDCLLELDRVHLVFVKRHKRAESRAWRRANHHERLFVLQSLVEQVHDQPLAESQKYVHLLLQRDRRSILLRFLS